MFCVDGNVLYQTEIWKSGSEPRGVDTTQNDSDRIEFETSYKNSSNKPITPRDKDGKSYVRAEGKPIGKITCFCSQADSGTNIGDGKELNWDFLDTIDDIAAPAGFKRKRIEANFLDSIYLKDGTIYYHNVLKGSYIDFYVVCPIGEVYLDNNGAPKVAIVDTIISYYVIHHPIQGTVAMGDELNTETVSEEIPNNYKFWLDITVPDADIASNGSVSIELYRDRTVVL